MTAGEPDPELSESGAYRPGTPRLYSLARPVLRRFDAQRLALLHTLVGPGARVLDAGAGQGRFVAAARAAGFDAHGIEPAWRGVQRAREIDAPIWRTSIEQAEITPGSLDAVTLWHVLEHVDDPRAVLERIATWLTPGGGLLVGVPNLASWQARISGGDWYHLDVPRHRSHFTPAGIGRLLDQTGFSVQGFEHRLLEHNPFGLWQSWLNRLSRNPSYLYNLLKRNVSWSSRDLPLTLLGALLIPVAAALERAAAKRQAGGTIAVLARRTT